MQTNPTATTEAIREHLMLEEGATRYATANAKAKARHELTSAESRLFKDAVTNVARAFDDLCRALQEQRGPKPACYTVLDGLGSVTCAAFALKLSFDAASRNAGYVEMCESIGRQAELELISKAVANGDEQLYKDLLKKMKRLPGGTAFKGKVFSEAAEEAGFWTPLDAESLVKIGASLFVVVQESTDLFEILLDAEGTSSQTMLVLFTEDAAERLSKIEGYEAWMRPVYRPMVVKPRPWTSAHTGCYLEPKVARTVQIMKTRNADHMKRVEAAVKANAPFVQALNAIQEVPLRINGWALDMVEAAYKKGLKVKSFPARVLSEVPEDATRYRKSKIKKRNNEIQCGMAGFTRDIAEAREYQRYGEFYLPSQLDWRGRVYAKPHLNHQRESHLKALFEFANGKLMTKEGAEWLAVHLASVGAFEGVNKAPWEARLKWTLDNTARICEMVKDPMEHDWWVKGDEAVMFLVACKAWADYQEKGEAYVCHLPIFVDGSCSGLQHLSTMLRDPEGARHVNIIPSDRPQDVYGVVAALVKERALESADDPIAQMWLSWGIDRKVAKRCVMTYVYGSKQFGFAEHIFDDFMVPLQNKVDSGELEAHPFGEDGGKTASQWMAKHVWEGVRQTVKAAAEGMDWLQEVAGVLASENKPVMWTTPMGLPVVNAYYESNSIRVALFLWDRALNVPKSVRPRVGNGSTPDLNKRKQRSSISPNVVHSLDSAHLMSVVLKASQENIKDFLLIHDSFGCSPADMPRFSKIVRETFCDMYTHHDPLQSLYELSFAQLSEKGRKKLKAPPAKGTLDLSGVLESKYAFL